MLPEFGVLALLLLSLVKFKAGSVSTSKSVSSAEAELKKRNVLCF
jgi:hypothetical protein